MLHDLFLDCCLSTTLARRRLLTPFAEEALPFSLLPAVISLGEALYPLVRAELVAAYHLGLDRSLLSAIMLVYADSIALHTLLENPPLPPPFPPEQ